MTCWCLEPIFGDACQAVPSDAAQAICLMCGHGLNSGTTITILPIGPGAAPCQILPDRHGSLDGDSRIGPIPIRDTNPRYQSETQYLQAKLGAIAEKRQSGDCLLFVSAAGRIKLGSGSKEETKRILVSSSRLPNFNQLLVIRTRF